MFLWARLVLNYLAANAFYDSEEFVNAASTLPRALSKLQVTNSLDQVSLSVTTNPLLATRNWPPVLLQASIPSPSSASDWSLVG